MIKLSTVTALGRSSTSVPTNGDMVLVRGKFGSDQLSDAYWPLVGCR